ncbi:MAG TPA: phenylalanine--tRNA ligase subunit alpha [candidate division WOR-3 bacterium]|uniref:Phenylalanine--tRNA ligase alpha subunit n=1 Tax=candidate division WOR-3 bacterium TaxID=2052148 RepID=A0A7C5I4C2_UNCW3|nr:MAG: phenylalanine--tRNA ligase subunit alpha [Candidatus Hydrothermae bacterium]HHF58008.1 phenylalanine--tRNA ligase subunit alpha [candidate division WOR-3 bacterium]
MSRLHEIELLGEEIEKEWKKVTSPEELENFRIVFFGKKGKVTLFLKSLKEFAPEERREAGRILNELKTKYLGLIQEKKEEFLHKLPTKKFDLHLPGRAPEVGREHPLTKVVNEILDIFVGLGFEEVGGKFSPDVEWDYYNFEALNIPPYHPAREMHDTFFITERMLLRTHTSPVQIRVMEKRRPPLRIVTVGKVYRVDPFDASHAPAFMQMEGLYIDRDVSFSELKGTLEVFARELFGPETQIKFVPSYFPFTEPSAEVYAKLGGEWMEILGCGMVHPNVLKNVGYDPEKWSGYAFGLGIERIAMIKYGIDDIRLFYENDVRFLKQL